MRAVCRASCEPIGGGQYGKIVLTKCFGALAKGHASAFRVSHEFFGMAVFLGAVITILLGAEDYFLQDAVVSVIVATRAPICEFLSDVV